MNPFARAEQHRPMEVAPTGWNELQHRYYALKARWGDRLWISSAGRDLAADIEIERARSGPLEKGESAIFATARMIALYWDVLNECAVGAKNLLLIGERGTGKEELAEVIARELGKEKVTVNCAQLVESIADAQLFGVAGNLGLPNVPPKGNEGFVQRARGKVLFLDELFDAPNSIFAKLLRLLQQRTFSRVGDQEEDLEDTVIVAASNRHPTRKMLADACAAGVARGDLVDRFDAVLEVLPLRERREEIPFLADNVLKRIWSSQPLGKRLFPFNKLFEESGRLLREVEHSWPGNLRDLRNLLREQGMLRRHENPGEHVLHISHEVLEIWLGMSQSVVDADSPFPTLSAWSREGVRKLREDQILAFLYTKAGVSRLPSHELDDRWVANQCRTVLKTKNLSQALKDRIGKTVSDLAEALQKMLRGTAST